MKRRTFLHMVHRLGLGLAVSHVLPGSASTSDTTCLLFPAFSPHPRGVPLKTPQGHVEINWREEGDKVALFWTERGGPRLTDGPDRAGFGTKLLQDTVTRQFGGTISQDWKPEGLVLAITLPAAALKR